MVSGTYKVLFALAALAMLGSLAATADTETPPVHLLVINGGNDSVLRYDSTTGAFIDEVIPAGSGGLVTAENIQIGPDGHLYVSSWSTGSVKRYDGTTGAFLGDFIAPGRGGLANPDQLAFGSDGHLYVSDRFSGRVLRYNGVTGESMGTFVADGRLHGFIAFTFGPDGHLYASMFNPAGSLPQCILRYNGQTGAFMDVFACPDDSSSAFSGLAFDPDGHLYAGRYHLGEVWRLDGGSGQFLGALHCPGDTRADYLAFGPDGKLYVSNLDGNNVSRFDVQTDQCLGAFLAGGALTGSTGLVFASASVSGPQETIWQIGSFDGSKNEFFIGAVDRGFKCDSLPSDSLGSQGPFVLGSTPFSALPGEISSSDVPADDFRGRRSCNSVTVQFAMADGFTFTEVVLEYSRLGGELDQVFFDDHSIGFAGPLSGDPMKARRFLLEVPDVSPGVHTIRIEGQARPSCSVGTNCIDGKADGFHWVDALRLKGLQISE